jgi:GntR family transcriptional repressor for pyruvate dehydrogenase complex
VTKSAASRPGRSDATELVVSQIRRAIGRGELNPGDRLPPERELAQQLGVSRPTVRSGLRVLAGMGIVRIRQGAGTFITDGPPALHSQPLDFLAALHGFTRRQLFEARFVLEVALASLAAQRGTSELLIALSDETTAMFASLDDPEAFLTHDVRFHRAIGAAADNPVLASMLEMVTSLFAEVRQEIVRSGLDLKGSAEEHRAIYRAIRAHDPERARRAMIEHLGRTEPVQVREDDSKVPSDYSRG